jgi:uncharacterized protein (TIGR00251 family)
MERIHVVQGGCELSVRVTPGAKRTQIVRWHDEALMIKVAAPPVEGAANAELVRFLARDVLGLPRSAVKVVRGEKSRTKTLFIGAAREDVERGLKSGLDPSP